jgi:L-arabinokinase
VINAFLARCPEARVCVRTAAARWLFDLTVRGPFEFGDVEVDFGVVQVDALVPDLAATLTRARGFYANPGPLIASEAQALRDLAASAVVADVPPLAFAAAHRAGVPAVALTNFTWDWIYEDYVQVVGEGHELPPRIRAWHGLAREAWRLPMHGGFAGFARVRDLPLVGRRSRRTREDTRARFGWGPHAIVVLVSFGGVGMRRLPLETVAASGEFVVLVTDDPPQTRFERSRPLVTVDGDGVTHVDLLALYGAGLRHEDLVAAADVVLTKPGYGIIADCIANGAPMLYTSRGRFAEYDALVRALPRWARATFISNEDLLEGRWSAGIRTLLRQGPPPERPLVDGAGVAAQWLEDLLAAGR